MPAAGLGGAAVTLLVLTAVAAAAAATEPRKSSQDQYEQQPRQAARAAAHDWVLLGRTGSHRFGPPAVAAPVVPELQVGCADGSVSAEPVPKKVLKARFRRDTRTRRQRRDYVRWYGNAPANQQTQFFQSYQLQSPAPFWIPIWGNPRRIPVFFPAKPILFNPGYPQQNKPSLTPTQTQSPGPEQGTQAPTETPVFIGNRILFEGRPVWGTVAQDETAAAAPSPPAVTERPPRRKPSPPLLHRPSVTDPPAQAIPTRPPTSQRAPQAPLQPPAQSQSSQGQSPAAGGSQGPNACVWAIILCCSPSTPEVRYNCFEQRGCTGAFWDGSPCRPETTAAALNAVQKFYDQS